MLVTVLAAAFLGAKHVWLPQWATQNA